MALSQREWQERKEIRKNLLREAKTNKHRDRYKKISWDEWSAYETWYLIKKNYTMLYINLSRRQ